MFGNSRIYYLIRNMQSTMFMSFDEFKEGLGSWQKPL